ncbi:MAG: hypothetical protein WA667_19490, partial [Candidatus Nitrosopolaris sp.]
VYVLILFVLSTNNGFFPLMFTFVIIMIIIVLRIRKAIQGTKVNVKKTIIFSTYFVAISSFLVYNSFLIGSVAVVYVIPYFAVVVAAIYSSYVYSKRTLSFLKLPDSKSGNSAIYVKGGLSIYFLYIAALIIRIGINFLFIGSEKFYFNNQQTILGNETDTTIMPMFHIDPATTILAFTVADFLLIIGVGLIIGRNTRVLKYYYQQNKRTIS